MIPSRKQNPSDELAPLYYVFTQGELQPLHISVTATNKLYASVSAPGPRESFGVLLGKLLAGQSPAIDGCIPIDRARASAVGASAGAIGCYCIADERGPEPIRAEDRIAFSAAFPNGPSAFLVAYPSPPRADIFLCNDGLIPLRPWWTGVPVAAPSAITESPSPRLNRMPLLACGISLLSLIAVGYLAVKQYTAVQPPAQPAAAMGASELPLKLEQRGGVLQLAWNRDTRGLETATGGVLLVDDGGQKLELTLDRAELMNGTVAYIPTSANVSFRLVVPGTQGTLTGSAQIGNAAEPAPVLPLQTRATAVAALSTTPTLEPSGQASRTRTVDPPVASPAPQPRQHATRQFDPQSVLAATERVREFDAPQLAAPPPLALAQSSPPALVLPAGVNAPAPPKQDAQQASPGLSRVSDLTSYVPPKIVRQQAPVMNATLRNLVRTMYGSALPVAVRVSIDASGTVTRAEALSAAPRIISDAAVDAARKWRFEAARLGGSVVSSQMVVRFVFRDE